MPQHAENLVKHHFLSRQACNAGGALAERRKTANAQILTVWPSRFLDAESRVAGVGPLQL